MNNEKKPREPLFHIAKRPAIAWQKAWGIRGIAILAAFLFSGIVIMLLTKQNPIDVYATMFSGNFRSDTKIWQLLQEMALLLCVSLAVTPAFKMHFWNIGAEGQVLIGGLATAACMIMLGGKISNGLLIIVMIVASIVAGALWALIPAIFKAKFNTNETLFTLMMNYVAIQLVSYFAMVWEKTKGAGTVGEIQYGWLPQIGGNDYVLNIVVVLILTVALYIYLTKSKHGYELTVVGESENTARYIGINVNKVIIRTMLLSGALCGVAGLLLVGGKDHTINSGIAGGRGFTAIMVSWLAKFNPLYMILTALLLAFMQKGAGEISTVYGIDKAVSDIITGIILFFIIGCEFFINYEIKFIKRHKEVE